MSQFDDLNEALSIPFEGKLRRQFLRGPARQGPEALLNLPPKDGQFAFLTALLTALLTPFLTAFLQALLFRFYEHRSQDLVIPNI